MICKSAEPPSTKEIATVGINAPATFGKETETSDVRLYLEGPYGVYASASQKPFLS